MALEQLYSKLLKLKNSRPAPGKVQPAHVEQLRQHHLQNHLRNVALIHQSAKNAQPGAHRGRS